MELAQGKADTRKVQKRHKEVIIEPMKKIIIKLLKQGPNPEQITGRSRLHEILMESHETIYR